MTSNQLTKEWLQQTIAELESVRDEIPFGIDTNSELELAAFKMALAAMDSEPVEWLNGCNKSVPAALRYLAENPRPIGGESSFNTAHLYQLAREIELMAEGTLYRHAQPAPVVLCPYPCGWDNLNKLAIQDAALVARGLVEGEPTTEAQRQAAISNNDRLLKVISACRAAMLAAAPQGVKQ